MTPRNTTLTNCLCLNLAWKTNKESKITVEDALSDLYPITDNSGGLGQLWKPYCKDFNSATAYQKEMRKEHIYEYIKKDDKYVLDTRPQDKKERIKYVCNHYTFAEKLCGPARDHDQIQLARPEVAQCCYGKTKMRHYEFNNGQRRRLTVREHCRLQSIPDYVVVAGSLERQFKSVNNCVPVGMAYAIGKTLVEAAGIGDTFSIESFNEADDDGALENNSSDLSWFIHDIFEHENLLDESAPPSAEHTCKCPDCLQLRKSNKGPGINYEVYWGEHWVREGYGRSSRFDTERQPHWEPDLELLGKEVVYRYAARLHRESTTGVSQRLHPRQNVGRKRRRSSCNVYDI